MYSLLKKVVPQKLRRALRQKQYLSNIVCEVIRFLEKEEKNIDAEAIKVLNFLKQHKRNITAYDLIYPYDFTKKYNATNVKVYIEDNYKYVIHDRHKLFFRSDWDVDKVRSFYNLMLIEQDFDSPHRYLSEGYQVSNGDVIAEVGVAEGMFSLSLIEKAKKIYLFERDEKWCEALQKTFAPWNEKVVIVNRMVSDTSDADNVTIDDFFSKNELNFIKADIDGNEIKLLRGAKETLKNNNLCMSLCTYHWQNDAEELEFFLTTNGFKTEYSKGYMIYSSDGHYIPPYLRHGVIRAKI